jgi:uncharacterized protein YcnI
MTLGLAVLAISAGASAHVTVSPAQSTPGAREKYEIRVPNERKSDTITVEFRFPAGLRVAAVEQKPGWQGEAFRDAAGNLTGVRWIGRLPPEQFTEFGLLAVNPAKAGELTFTVIQAFADGTKIEWSGARDRRFRPRESSSSHADHSRMRPSACSALLTSTIASIASQRRARPSSKPSVTGRSTGSP